MPALMHLSLSLDVGGLENLILNLCRHLDRGRYRLAVCSLSEGLALRPEFEALGIPVYAIPKRDGFDWRLIPGLASLLRRERIDILHTHNGAAYLYGVLAARGAGTPAVVHTEHSNTERIYRKLRRAQRFLSYLAHPIIADSQDVANALIQDQAIHPRRVQVILNGIDVQRFRPRPPDLNLQRALGLRSTERVIGIVARLVPLKNHALLLRSFAQLRRERSDLRLLIVGDGPCRPALQALAGQLDVAEAVIFAGNRRDVPECLSLMDAFALPSRTEGLPLTILEAMAAGVPVVATAVGGIPEVLRHGENGLLVKSEDLEGLTQSLRAILEDPQRARSLAERARADVVERYSLESMTRHYERVYAEALRATPEKEKALSPGAAGNLNRCSLIAEP